MTARAEREGRSYKAATMVVFGGMMVEQAAERIGRSSHTVQRDLRDILSGKVAPWYIRRHVPNDLSRIRFMTRLRNLVGPSLDSHTAPAT